MAAQDERLEASELHSEPGLLEGGRELYRVFRTTLHFTFKGRPEPARVARYMYEMGNQSLVFLCIVMGFVGMIIVYQAGIQLQRVVPDMTQLGPSFIELLIKDLAPTLCGLMLSTRVGAGIAAEIGSMVVTEQVDALRMCAADPIDYLIRTRFIASVLMTPILVILAAFVAFLAGMWTANAFFEVNPETFATLTRVGAGAVVIGLLKCVAYGAAIPVVSGHSGLNTYGGSEGVGSATTRAVVNSSLAVIILDFLLSALGYALFE